MRCPSLNRWPSARATATQPQANRGGRRRPIRVRLPDAPAMLSYPRWLSDCARRRSATRGHATVSNLNMARPTAAWLAARIEAQWLRTADGHIESERQDRPDRARRPVAAARVSAGERSSGAAASVECDRHAQRSLVRVRTRQRRQRAEVLAADSRSSTSAFAPVQRAPGARGLSGAVRMTHEAGELKLDSRDVQFELPRMFREPLAAQEVAATVRWRNSGEAWTIESGDVRIEQRRRQRNGALQRDDPRRRLIAHAGPLGAGQGPEGELDAQIHSRRPARRAHASSGSIRRSSTGASSPPS